MWIDSLSFARLLLVRSAASDSPQMANRNNKKPNSSVETLSKTKANFSCANFYFSLIESVKFHTSSWLEKLSHIWADWLLSGAAVNVCCLYLVRCPFWPMQLIDSFSFTTHKPSARTFADRLLNRLCFVIPRDKPRVAIALYTNGKSIFCTDGFHSTAYSLSHPYAADERTNTRVCRGKEGIELFFRQHWRLSSVTVWCFVHVCRTKNTCITTQNGLLISYYMVWIFNKKATIWSEVKQSGRDIGTKKATDQNSWYKDNLTGPKNG